MTQCIRSEEESSKTCVAEIAGIMLCKRKVGRIHYGPRITFWSASMQKMTGSYSPLFTIFRELSQSQGNSLGICAANGTVAAKKKSKTTLISEFNAHDLSHLHFVSALLYRMKGLK
jgi:hypothetical protein